jgi:hypothetical protein
VVNKPPTWTRNNVHQFLNNTFRGDVTTAQLVVEARQRFPNQKSPPAFGQQIARRPREVDPYVERSCWTC